MFFDSELLEAIYDTYQRPIYRSIYRQVGDVETARDLTADVFHRLLQAVQKGKGPSRDAKAWLYRTAHNLVVDYYRRQQFRSHLPLEKDLATGEPGPAQVAEDHALAETIREALARLTPEQSQVITLKFLDGLSTKEVASMMDKTPGAVKSLQHRGLAGLQHAFKKAGHLEPELFLESHRLDSAQKVKLPHPRLATV